MVMVMAVKYLLHAKIAGKIVDDPMPVWMAGGRFMSDQYVCSLPL